MDRTTTEFAPASDSADWTAETASSASHPAIARALDDILGDKDTSALFSNFVSHSSAAG